VSLLDENTGVMDALGETELVHASLKTALQEIFDLEGEHVIELHAGFVEDTDTDKTANEGISFEEALGVFLIEGEQFTIPSRQQCISVAHKQNHSNSTRWKRHGA
jgi:hypothetical protein